MVRPAQRPRSIDTNADVIPRDLTANPAWLTTAVADVYDVLEAKVPPAWLPKLTGASSQRGKFVAQMKEYGCGNYGCVVPTLDAAVVLKATTDVTETQFAAKLAQTLVVPVVVEYFMVVALAARWHGRRISLLWRESAQDVGEGELERVIGKKDGKRAVRLLHEQHAAAAKILRAILEGAQSMDVLGEMFDAWTTTLDNMTEVGELEYVATGMKRVWLEQHIFLADVHSENLGRCMRDDQLEWVITDPGNVIVIEL